MRVSDETLASFYSSCGIVNYPTCVDFIREREERGFTITFKWSQGMEHNPGQFYHNAFVFAGVRSSFFSPEF